MYELPKINVKKVQSSLDNLLSEFSEDNFISFNGDDIRKDFTVRGVVVRSMCQKVYDTLKSTTVRINADVDLLHKDQEDARLSPAKQQFQQDKIRNTIETEAQLKQFYQILTATYDNFVGETFKPYVHSNVPTDTKAKGVQASNLIYAESLKAR